jgi:hypothetical protein
VAKGAAGTEAFGCGLDCSLSDGRNLESVIRTVQQIPDFGLKFLPEHNPW